VGGEGGARSEGLNLPLLVLLVVAALLSLSAGIVLLTRADSEPAPTTTTTSSPPPTEGAAATVPAAEPVPHDEVAAEAARALVSLSMEVAWAPRLNSWLLLWTARQSVALHVPPGLGRPLDPGERVASSETHLYGLLDDGRWFAVDILGDRPCGHLAGAWFGCEPWSDDDPWWVPAFIREPEERGGDPVAVYGYLPPDTFRVVVIFTDDSPATVVVNDRIWAAAIPKGAGIRTIGFADENDAGILELARVPPDGWWMTEFER
jgi:hypothetical protein